ncbi:beta-ketoacyl synthase N-terminal-like domain-containing protein [Mangrovimonas sp. DI 80]|uniref:beta-ketoacyl synthase N-terminal-like domain-containing protein n=1 Tax=Mangrovimonas sp. DI 80 TaxID=1779330 RepID=UPI00097704D0|nr:beta-ketoacyl synthase N-terminal-like domain-containing protein [Mangrovimonas sp. DI 80]OMP31444.1 beta-ketoacyl synthase [Mangrovimonas sp. DI 80]
MNKVYVSHNNIVSALGFDSASVVEKIKSEVTGLGLVVNKTLHAEPFFSSLVNAEQLQSAFQELKPKEKYTRLEQMMIVSLDKIIKSSKIALGERVGLIISTTKGNIDVLDDNSPFPKERAYLSELGRNVKEFFGFKNDVIVVSNACVSGILSVALAKRYIEQNVYDHVFVVSGDVVSEFILSGFNSFQAMSHELCKPYDKHRKGINIGEVAASILVTKDDAGLPDEAMVILGEGSCNDANHISGPSRTGEGLYRSMQTAFREAKIQPEEIDYISAHGTATLFNDEMEAIAFNRMGLQEAPLNSLKGYFGHTLGASGLLETIIGMHSAHNNTLYKSLGFETMGVTQPINVINYTRQHNIQTFLKTASGFGGCNTAVIFQKLAQ